jgi:exonuclease SbcD
VGAAEEVNRKSGIELFEEFYTAQNGQPMSEEQRGFALGLLERLEEEMA